MTSNLETLKGFVEAVRGEIAKVIIGQERTVDFARRIAQLPTMSALLIKEAVNQSVDNMGFYNALNACFTLHELNHSHWAQVHENGFPAALEEDGVPHWKQAPPVAPALKDQVRAEP